MNPLALVLAVLLAFVGWFSTDSGEAGVSLAVAGIVVSNRRRLQDEAAKIHSDIEALRSAAPESDQEQADNLGRLGELEARADSIAVDLERENATDARLSRLRTAASFGTSTVRLLVLMVNASCAPIDCRLMTLTISLYKSTGGLNSGPAPAEPVSDRARAFTVPSRRPRRYWETRSRRASSE